MNRRGLAGLLTVIVLGLVIGIGSLRRPSGPVGTSDSDATAEDRLRALIESARAGDVDGYLDAFADPIRSRVEREADEVGRQTFADAIRRASESRKGLAIFAPEPDGPDAVRIVVESVYPDRNERQVYRLERRSEGWKIADFESVRGRQPAERYGTEATYKAPEGVPVQGVDPAESSESLEDQGI